jgi:probable rRNA maturation factor
MVEQLTSPVGTTLSSITSLRSANCKLFKKMVIFRKPVSGTSEQTLARFLARARRAAGVRGGVTVVVTGNRELRDLNRRFRGKDKPTDVLSFPVMGQDENDSEGDIAISADIAADNAVRLGHAASTELKILVLHGLLHLAGYDHESDNGQMARREARLRRELRLPLSLIERTQVYAQAVTPSSAGRPLRRAAGSFPAKRRVEA